MLPDDASGTDLDHGDVPRGRDASHQGGSAARRRDVPLAGELDAPHTRSMTPAIAWPKPMHIAAMP